MTTEQLEAVIDGDAPQRNHDGTGDKDSNENDEIASDNDDDSLMEEEMDIPLEVVESFSSTINHNKKKVGGTENPTTKLINLVDTSIMDCFQLAIRTHDVDKVNNNKCDITKKKDDGSRILLKEDDNDVVKQGMDWNAPPLYVDNDGDGVSGKDRTFLKSWTPSTTGLALPIWAVVPSSTN